MTITAIRFPLLLCVLFGLLLGSASAVATEASAARVHVISNDFVSVAKFRDLQVLALDADVELTAFQIEQAPADAAAWFDADLVIFDPRKQVTLSTQTLHENVDWTPYDGVELHGESLRKTGLDRDGDPLHGPLSGGGLRLVGEEAPLRVEAQHDLPHRGLLAGAREHQARRDLHAGAAGERPQRPHPNRGRRAAVDPHLDVHVLLVVVVRAEQRPHGLR